MKPTVIFDLDGTLADTAADLVAAANASFRGLGLGDMLDPVGDARTAMMGGGRAMLRLGFERAANGMGEAEVETQYPLLLEAYSSGIDRHTRLYPGAAEAIGGLADAGYALGICTNKPEALADRLLVSLGVRQFFAGFVGADTLPVRKPDAAPLREAVARSGGDPARAVLVGDSPTDRETARAAGMLSLLVTFGPDGRGVVDLEPEGLLDDYAGLAAAVRALIG